MKSLLNTLLFFPDKNKLPVATSCVIQIIPENLFKQVEPTKHILFWKLLYFLYKKVIKRQNSMKYFYIIAHVTKLLPKLILNNQFQKLTTLVFWAKNILITETGLVIYFFFKI